MDKTKIMSTLIILAALATLFVACTTTEPIIEPKKNESTEPEIIVIDDPEPKLVPGEGDIVVEVGDFEQAQFYTPGEDIKTKTFSSVEELNTFLQNLGGGESYYYADDMMMRGDVMMESAVAMDAAMPSSGGLAKTSNEAMNLDYSETNNQVEGVDEGDIIKTDGNYIYTITGKTLFIIKAYPGVDAEIVARVAIKDKNPEGLFISEDSLAIYGRVNNYDAFEGISTRNGLSFFNVYDISDRDDPELVKELTFDGRTLDARMKGDIVYYVLRSIPYYGTPIRPYIINDGDVKRMPVDHITYFDYPYQSAQFVTVHSVDLSKEQLLDSETVTVENGQELYMSHNNIFITANKYISEWEIQRKITIEMVKPELNTADKRLIRKIEQTDNDVLSQREKENKIYSIISNYINYLQSDEREDLQDEIEKETKEELEDYKYFEYTVVTRISIDDGEIDVEANGEVPGRIVNQFSMDEYEGVFRIATTVNARWSRFISDRTESTNHIFTLDEDLNIMDALDDLAEGERIYSTRFMGEKLYLVTFRQVDPFFVIDLSNPNDIENLGELKIPGFSRYLHPYSEDVIIGLGRDASETGRQQGLKISLFDVSDPSDPEEIASWVGDERWAQTTAEYEHKAFLFSKEKNMLVIPAFNYERSWNSESGEGYNGAFVFHIEEDEIELRGLIDHSSSEQQYYYRSAVERSLYIEDLLYTKSSGLLRINEIEDLSSVKSIELKENKIAGIPVY